MKTIVRSFSEKYGQLANLFVGRAEAVLRASNRSSVLNRLGRVFTLPVLAVALVAVGTILLANSAVAGSIGAYFFSQRDARWSGNRLGTCNTTIAKSGCAITSCAMALSARGTAVSPASLNAYLTANGGYANGCDVYWARVVDYDGPGGLRWVGLGQLPSTPLGLKALLDSGYAIIARSQRFAPSDHWVIIAGYGALEALGAACIIMIRLIYLRVACWLTTGSLSREQQSASIGKNEPESHVELARGTFGPRAFQLDTFRGLSRRT